MLSYKSRGILKKMNKNLNNLNEKNFRRIVGVKRGTFEYLLRLLNGVKRKKHKAGPKERLSNKNKLLLTLQYWSNYNSLLEVGNLFKVSESTACRIVKQTESMLAKTGLCKLPGKKAFLNTTEEVVIIDVTECPIERPKRKKQGRLRNRQKYYYSGKKKRHTIKAQIVVVKNKICSTAFSNGRRHDFRLFKESKTRLHQNKTAKVDSGYQGLQKIHSNTDLPQKGTKKSPLTKDNKIKNREQAKDRVCVEHVIGWVKKFKIISTKYRNRRKRFALRFNLICGIYNYENTGEL